MKGLHEISKEMEKRLDREIADSLSFGCGTSNMESSGPWPPIFKLTDLVEAVRKFKESSTPIRRNTSTGLSGHVFDTMIIDDPMIERENFNITTRIYNPKEPSDSERREYYSNNKLSGIF